jgi:DNA-binding CsgD family transcriptional regulator
MPATIASSRAERAIAEISRLSVAGLDAVELLRRAAAAVHPVVPFDGYCAGVMDPGSQLIQRGVAEGMGDDLPDADEVGMRYFDRVYFEEDLPRVRKMMRAGLTVASLREATRGQPERSLRYRELLRPYGFAAEAGVIFVDRGLWGGLDLMRGSDLPDYGPGELDLLRRIVPGVAAGLRSAALRARAAEDPDGDDAPGVLVIDETGEIRSATPAARRLMADLEPSEPAWRGSEPLPIPVLMALGALEQAVGQTTDPDRAVVPRLRARSRSGRLFALHADLTEPTAGRPSERIVVIAPARTDDIAWLNLAAHALTAREEEVVRLVVAGLSTRQISEKLFIAEHTVQRHLSNIFEKVGVRSRRDLVKRFFMEQVGAAAG